MPKKSNREAKVNSNEKPREWRFEDYSGHARLKFESVLAAIAAKTYPMGQVNLLGQLPEQVFPASKQAVLTIERQLGAELERSKGENSMIASYNLDLRIAPQGKGWTLKFVYSPNIEDLKNLKLKKLDNDE